MFRTLWFSVTVAVCVSVVLVGLSGGIGAVTGADDAGPLADAGLDQTTTEGSTVYLDAGGSTAPDGSIDSYAWEIETPDGETIEPECPTCVRTSFVASEPGTYEVSVTVTDDAGRTDSDTLYVEVEPYEPPAVTVDGPETVQVGEERTYTAEATATEEPLASLLWRHDDQYHGEASVTSQWSVTERTNVTFDEPGIHEINATVADELGYQATDGTTVEVMPPEPFFEVTITDIDDTVMAGNSLAATVTVENVGDAEATQPVSLVREGTPVDRHDDVSLAPGETRTLDFEWSTGGADRGTHEFLARSDDDTDREEATVEVSRGEGTPSLEIGNLDAEIEDLRGPEVQLELELVLNEEYDDPSVEIDPAEHEVTFVTEDGEEAEVNDDGTVLLEQADAGEGDVQVEFENGIQSQEHDSLGVTRGRELEDAVDGPERERGFRDRSHIERPTGPSSSPGSSIGDSGGGVGTSPGGAGGGSNAGTGSSNADLIML